MDEETMVAHREWDRALDSTFEYITNAKVPARWRAKALGDAVIAAKSKQE
jgi:hypothetical protein